MRSGFEAMHVDVAATYWISPFFARLPATGFGSGSDCAAAAYCQHRIRDRS
jgi:hypothetical protein